MGWSLLGPIRAAGHTGSAAAGRLRRPEAIDRRGRLGVRLDSDVEWDEIAAIVTDAFRIVAPTSLVRDLDHPTFA